jgi:hypothetical protein
MADPTRRSILFAPALALGSELMTPTFGKIRFGATNGVAPLSMGLPPASYPGAVATNAQLAVAVDRLQTRLAVPLAATDTVMQVQSGAGIVASCLLTIDNEIVQVLSGSGTSWTISRGFDGTTPALHLGSSIVSGFIDAWHHNALVAEVQAIEQVLGPNLSRIPATPFLISTTFDFAAQSPGGTLSAGNNVITMTPVPQGVNGTDTNHRLYISGGTGAPEAVLITGGTAVAGAASGTVIVQCANAHSGAWSIDTATAGIQEAVIVAQGLGQGLIFIPAGIFTVHASINVSGSSIKIRGAGRRATLVQRDVTLAAFDIFTLSSSGTVGNEVSGMSLGLTGTAATGWAVKASNQNNMLLRDLDAQTPSGISLIGCGYSNIENSIMMLIASGEIGIYVAGGIELSFQQIYLGTSAGAPGFAAIYLDGGSAFFFHTIDAIQFTKGVYFAATQSPIQFMWFESVSMDTMADTAWEVLPSGNAIVSVVCTNCWAATSNTGQGIDLNAATNSIYGFKWVGGRVYANGANGIKINGDAQDTQIIGSTIAGNGRHFAGSEILIQTGASKVSITDNLIGQADAPVGATYWNPVTPTALFGIDVSTSAIDNLLITDNRFTGGYVTGAMRQNSTGTHNVINRNAGIDNQPPGSIASATAIAIPNTGASLFYVTGTAAISTILGGNVGQSLSLIFNNASPGGVAAGGNIAKAIPASQNQRLTGVFDGTSWYFQ